MSRSVSGVVRAESTGSDIRDRCRDMLYKAMKKHVTECECGSDGVMGMCGSDGDDVIVVVMV